jgi:hypothetical protein
MYLSLSTNPSCRQGKGGEGPAPVAFFQSAPVVPHCQGMPSAGLKGDSGTDAASRPGSSRHNRRFGQVRAVRITTARAKRRTVGGPHRTRPSTAARAEAKDRTSARYVPRAESIFSSRSPRSPCRAGSKARPALSGARARQFPCLRGVALSVRLPRWGDYYVRVNLERRKAAAPRLARAAPSTSVLKIA